MGLGEAVGILKSDIILDTGTRQLNLIPHPWRRLKTSRSETNHNLGVLAVLVDKAEVALPLFKAALEPNPKIEQFWRSYIDALIKEKQFDNAKGVLEEAKKQGVDA